MKRYHKNHLGLELELPKTIKGYYTRNEDFTQRANVSIFINKEEFQIWLKRFREIEGTYNIRKTILNTMAQESEPYFFQNTEGRIFLIQNVSSKEIGRAHV